jgi:hypothetical protein
MQRLYTMCGVGCMWDDTGSIVVTFQAEPRLIDY